MRNKLRYERIHAFQRLVSKAVQDEKMAFRLVTLLVSMFTELERNSNGYGCSHCKADLSINECASKRRQKAMVDAVNIAELLINDSDTPELMLREIEYEAISKFPSEILRNALLDIALLYKKNKDLTELESIVADLSEVMQYFVSQCDSCSFAAICPTNNE